VALYDTPAVLVYLEDSPVLVTQIYVDRVLVPSDTTVNLVLGAAEDGETSQGPYRVAQVPIPDHVGQLLTTGDSLKRLV
jgi:hypothetical protein